MRRRFSGRGGSDRAVAWSKAQTGQPRPCLSCGIPAAMRNPFTGSPQHLQCAKAEAEANGEEW